MQWKKGLVINKMYLKLSPGITPLAAIAHLFEGR